MPHRGRKFSTRSLFTASISRLKQNNGAVRRGIHFAKEHVSLARTPTPPCRSERADIAIPFPPTPRASLAQVRAHLPLSRPLPMPIQLFSTVDFADVDTLKAVLNSKRTSQLRPAVNHINILNTELYRCFANKTGKCSGIALFIYIYYNEENIENTFVSNISNIEGD